MGLSIKDVSSSNPPLVSSFLITGLYTKSPLDGPPSPLPQRRCLFMDDPLQELQMHWKAQHGKTNDVGLAWLLHYTVFFQKSKYQKK